MELSSLIDCVQTSPDSVEFADVMDVIAQHYEHTPSSFTNGDLENHADQNQGSAKILAFAQIHGFTEAQTLACFGAYYRVDVLGHPEGDDHGNIRNFMKYGWSKVSLPAGVLVAKSA